MAISIRPKHLLLSVTALALCGCGGGEKAYREAINNGRKTLPCIASFEKMFPDHVHQITHYTGDYGPSLWQSEAYLYDRYVLAIEIPDLVFDATRTHITKWGTPRFILMEVTGVKEPSIHTDGVWLVFDLAKWMDLERAGGDLASLGVTVKRHDPVKGFSLVRQKP